MTTSTERGNHNPNQIAKPYSVTLWGSNPDETDNDDCWTGAEFTTQAEASACYRGILAGCAPWPACRGGWEYVMIDGPDVHDVKANPDQRAVRAHRLTKVARVRRSGYPVGTPAPMMLRCPCGAGPDAPAAGETATCSCGARYDSAGYVQPATEVNESEPITDGPDGIDEARWEQAMTKRRRTRKSDEVPQWMRDLSQRTVAIGERCKCSANYTINLFTCALCHKRKSE